MSGLKSRNKGKNGERQAAKLLSELLNGSFSRGVQFKGSPDSPDVAGLAKFGLHCETKRDETTAGVKLYKAIRQAYDDCGDNIPFVLTRKNRHDWLIVLKAEDLVGFSRRIISIVDGEES